MTTEPLVSIGLPTYNGAKSIQRALESVLSQDYSNLELIISDNASTDDTERLCQEFACKDNRIHYFRQNVNQGATRNFEFVLQKAEGKYFMWLGDDDWIETNFVSQCLQELQDNSGTVLTCGHVRYHNEQGYVGEGKIMNLIQNSACERVYNYYQQVDDNGIIYGLARREVIEKAFPIKNVMGGDWLFVANIAFCGKITTVENTVINRLLGNTSAGPHTIVQSLGLPAFQAYFPHQCIAWYAVGDILWSCDEYKSISPLARFNLAVKVAFAILKKWKPLPHTLIPAVVHLLKFVLPVGFYKKIRSCYRNRRKNK